MTEHSSEAVRQSGAGPDENTPAVGPRIPPIAPTVVEPVAPGLLVSIMNMPCVVPPDEKDKYERRIAYMKGHRDARQAAAELVVAAPQAPAIPVGQEQLEADALAMALRLLGEDSASFAPETRAAMERMMPKIDAALRAAREG